MTATPSHHLLAQPGLAVLLAASSLPGCSGRDDASPGVSLDPGGACEATADCLGGEVCDTAAGRCVADGVTNDDDRDAGGGDDVDEGGGGVRRRVAVLGAAIALVGCAGMESLAPVEPFADGKAPAPYVMDVAVDDPVAHWRLPGPAKGALVGDADGAIRLDGVIAQRLSSTAFGGEAVTVEMWVRGGSGGALSYATVGQPDALQVVVDGTLRVVVFGDLMDTGLALGEGWRHVAVRWNAGGGQVSALVDGEASWSATLEGAGPMPPGGRFVLGQLQGCYEGCYLMGFDGAVDEVAVYNHAVPDARLRHHVEVARGQARPTEGPIRP